MPAVVQQTGTGSAYWYADWMQNPVNIGMALVFSGAAGTATVQYTFDAINAQDVNFVASPTWWTLIAAGSANATSEFRALAIPQRSQSRQAQRKTVLAGRLRNTVVGPLGKCENS